MYREFLTDTSFVPSAVRVGFSGLITAGVIMNYTGAKQGWGRKRSTKSPMAKN